MRVEFTLSQDDFVAGCNAHCWRRYTPRWERIQKVTQPVLATLFIVFSFIAYRWGDRFAPIFMGLAGVYLLAAPMIITPYLWRRLYRRTRGKGGPIILTVTGESIHVDCPGRSTGTVEWSAILGVLDRPKVTLLYTSPALPMILPRRVLTDTTHDQLLSICRTKDIPFTYPITAKRTAKE